MLSVIRAFFLACAVILFINGCATAPHPLPNIPATAGVYHIVGSGQTLWRIAKTYNVDVNAIMRANNINDPGNIGVGQELLIPGALAPKIVQSYSPGQAEPVDKIVGPKYPLSRWRYITIHHSATLGGNAESFDRNHRMRHMGGLFYHFVIGNGKGSGDGEVEVGFRWRKQKFVNRPYDIQICLVGDFNRQQITAAQFDSLVKLINTLRREYGIPLSRIRKHKDIHGKATECPGSCFPFSRLIAELRKS